MEQARISVIIINYKTPGLTLQAIRSLYKELDLHQDCIVVVDNCSGDDSVNQIKAGIHQDNWPGEIRLIESDRNGGFSYGNNLGIAQIKARGYLLLNSDAMVLPGAVINMWKALQHSPELGIIGPKVVDENLSPQVSCFVNHTLANEFLQLAKTGILTRILGFFGVKEVALEPVSQQQQVDWVSFVCVLIRAEAYQDIGTMDDGYFMYKEDNDYCRRAWKKGWKVLYYPDASVIHLNQGWSAKQLSRKPDFYYQSRARYFYKYYGMSGYILANLLWLSGRVIYWLREQIEHKTPVTPEKAWLDIWTFKFGTRPVWPDDKA